MTELVEAVGSVTKKNGKWRAKIIAADVKGSSAFYPAAVVEAGAPLFKAGVQMFKNHLSADEQWNRPEGDVNNLVGVLETDAVYEADNPEGPGLYSDLNIFSDQKAWLKERAPHIGLSIRANGIVQESDDGPVLQQFTEVLSVDVVTKAGAGGKFVSLAESAKPGVLSEDTVQESTAGVAEHSEETVMDKEIAEAFDTLRNEFIEKLTGLTESLAPVIEAAAPKEQEKQVEESKAPKASDITEALIESGLTKTARARVLAAVEGGAELAEAIKAEKDLAAEILAESGKAKQGEGKEFQGNLEESKSEKPNLGSLVFGN